MEYTYDASGNRLTVTDAAGTVSYTYDALGRATSVTDRRDNIQRFEYDAPRIQPRYRIKST